MDRALKAVAAMMLMMFFAVGCNKPIESSHEDDENVHNGHEYVVFERQISWLMFA